MLKITVYLLLLYSIISLFLNPWVPLLFYYLNGIMQPQFIWPWTFPEFSISVSKILAIASILALMKSMISGQVDFAIYKSKQNLALVTMWILMHISDSLSPFPNYFAGVKSEIVLSAMNTIVILYFVGLGILSNQAMYEKAFKNLCIMFAFITVYYVYWANDMYFSNRWDMFTDGRLNSPRGTSIGDQNALSALVIMGMPFFLIGYFYVKNKMLKLFCLALIPILWHSIFLFGSRGAMIALAVTTFATLRMLGSHKVEGLNALNFKHVGLFKQFILVGFVAAALTQGGIMLSRTSDTADKARQQTEEPLNPRLVSWMVGKKLILEYPLLGAGPQRFQMASMQLFPGESVHVAHNTFINFSANTGLPVGLLFLSMFWFNYKNFQYCKKNKIEKYPILDFVDKSCACALIAYFVAALFLDMIIFEAFYFILMLNLAKRFVFEKELKLAASVENIDRRETIESAEVQHFTR
ncbi:O-antigen ligase family protein [Brumicola pallidula]|nr:O-antigen ligase family protein [Glaciecola pallidula]